MKTLESHSRFLSSKKYGIQYILDVIRQYYATPDKLNPEDGQAVRSSFLEIVKYYIQKEINIKEVSALLSVVPERINESLSFRWAS